MADTTASKHGNGFWAIRRRGGPGAAVRLLVGLLAIGISAGSAWAAPRIMIIGDSLQSGTNLRHVTRQTSYQLQRRLKVIVHNFTSPGARMTDVGVFAGMNHATMAVSLLHGFFRMQGLVVALGTNDWSGAAGLDMFRQTYTDFLASLPSGLPIACLGPPWRVNEEQPNGNGDTLDDFREAARQACDAVGGEFLDGKAAVPNDLSYYPDGLHPNERGHRAMARFLADEIDRLGWLP